MATMNGSTAASSVFGGWKAFAEYTVTTTDANVQLNVTKAGMRTAGADVSFYWSSNSLTPTIKVGGSTDAHNMNFWHDEYREDNRNYLHICTSTTLTTPRTWTIDFPRGRADLVKTTTVSVTLPNNFGMEDWNGTIKSVSNTSSSGSISVTVPALESWTVTLDAQGGTGAASTLTKYYGEALALPQPVKNGYEFSHWTDGTTNYTTSYTANAAASLVAVWTPIISAATITQLYAARDDGRFLWDSQTGKHTSASDDGEYVYIRAWWRVDGADAATISLGASMADTSTVWTGATRQVSKPGTGELYIEGVAEWGTTKTALATGQYDVTVTLSTGTGNPSDTRGTTVPTAFFTIDVLAGGHGIAFGKPATQQLFDVGMETNFDHDVRVLGTPLVPVGTLLDFAGSTAPSGYLVCDGSAVSRTDYAALFAVIDTTWGAGDGSTTFNIPDFRGRVSIGSGTGTGGNATAHALGSKGGDEAMQSHTHAPTTTAGWNFQGIKPESGVTGSYNLQTHGSGANRYAYASTNSSGAFSYWSATASTGAGSSGNMQPFATVTKIIRAI